MPDLLLWLRQWAAHLERWQGEEGRGAVQGATFRKAQNVRTIRGATHVPGPVRYCPVLVPADVCTPWLPRCVCAVVVWVDRYRQPSRAECWAAFQQGDGVHWYMSCPKMEEG
jgi:hypothetical protein